MGIRNPTMIRNQAELGENNTAAVDKMYDVETLPKNKTQFLGSECPFLTKYAKSSERDEMRAKKTAFKDLKHEGEGGEL